MRPISLQRQSGFTLLELLVASAIFVVIGAISYTGWFNIQQLKSSTEEQAERLDELQRAWYWIAEDFEQVTDRQVRDQFGSKKLAFETNEVGDSQLEFTRAGWINPAADLLPGRSSLQRVAYNVEDDKLYRYYWYHLDRFDEESKTRRLLISDVDSFSMRFLSDDDKWRDDWPDRNSSNAPGLPKAVEIVVELPGMGRIARRFLVP